MRLEIPAEFFSTHWRREPILLSGIASQLASAEELGYRGLREYAATRPDSRGDNSTIWFLERLHDSPAWAGELRAAAAEVFEWDDIWCDLFVTAGSSSIGRHFDDSENFTIQLTGTKTWRLQAPGSVPVDWRRRRALGEPGVGGLPRTPTADDLVFTAGPGDVLYIPSMWQHEGRSVGDSASISLVVNTATPFHALYPAVEQALRRSAAWTAPLEIGPGSARRRAAQMMTAVAPETFEQLRDALTAETRARSGPGRRSPRQTAPPVSIDMSRLRDYVASSPEVPSADVVLLRPGPASAFAGLAARRNARRLARLLVTRASQTTCERARSIYAAAGSLLGGLDPGQSDRVLTDPDVTSWISAAWAHRDDALPRPRAEDPDADVLAAAILPELIGYYQGAPLVLCPGPDIDGGLTLRRLGLRLPARSVTAGAGRLVIDGRTLTYCDGSGSRIIADRAAPPFEELGTINGGGAVICPSASQWFADQAPWGAAVHTADPRELADLTQALAAAVTLLDRCYPSAAQVYRANIRAILPLPSIGHRANNYSLPGFRGLIATSSREPYMIAQALAHETAHNQVNSILEVTALCTNPGELVISPVVGTRRPLTAVFHGCVAFCQDIYVSAALADQVPDAAPRIEKYVAGRITVVEETIALLKERASLTSLGKTIISEAERITSHAR
jgi:HEXXH motif-containing protein